MAYADYDFYTGTYYGGLISEEDFNRFSERASEKLDMFTFGRLERKLPRKQIARTKIEKAVCAVADALYQIEMIRSSVMAMTGVIENGDGTVKSKLVSSVSSGSESISYSTSVSGANSNSIYSKAAADQSEENRLLLGIVTGYLSGVTDDTGVCLLYAGM